MALRCGGHWTDHDLRGALYIFDDPQDLLDRWRRIGGRRAASTGARRPRLADIDGVTAPVERRNRSGTILWGLAPPVRHRLTPTPTLLRLIRSSAASRYGAATAATGLGLGLRLMLGPILGLQLPYVTLFPAVMFSAWLGGFGPGLLSTLLSAVAAAYAGWSRHGRWPSPRQAG